MAGFFTKEQTKSIVRPDGRHLSCNSCGLYKYANTPKMTPYGEFAKEIMLIGEFPDETDDVRGKPFQSKAGSLLRKTLRTMGVDMDRDCVSLNAINCRPIKKVGFVAKPEPFQLDCCQRIVFSAIRQYKPKVIILLGASPLKSIIGSRYKKDLGGIAKWAGYTIPDQEFMAWVCPVLSPQQVLRDENVVVTAAWEQDLRGALKMLHVIDFPVYHKPNIHYLDGDLSVLDKITGGKIAFDYETTGLKPHRKGHKIVCASVAVSEMDVYTFMMPEKMKDARPFINLLERESVGKLAHNMKFEHTWTYNCLRRTVVKGWLRDCMLVAHILDNREGVTGLKFQTYAQFGVVDYSSEITPFLEGTDPKDSNSHNKLEEAVKSPEMALKVLMYCALDSVFTYRLDRVQQQVMEQLQLPF